MAIGVTTVVLYNQAIGAAGSGTSRLVCVGTLVTGAAAGQQNSVEVAYFVELTGGDANSRVPLLREDFLAVRQLRNLATP